MIFVTDVDGACIYASREWTALTGQDVAEALGQGWLGRVHPDDRDIVTDTMAAAIGRAEEFGIRYRLIKPDGGLRWVGADGIPSFGIRGDAFIGHFGTVTELTEGGTDTIKAYGSIGRFAPPAPHPNTAPAFLLDKVADHLLLAHALIEADGGNEALPDLRRTLFKIGQALAARSMKPERLN